jgi:hypothetical protein
MAAMNLKNPAAKIGTVGLSAIVFASLWGWIAERGSGAGAGEYDAVSAAPTSVAQRVYIVRTQDANGTVTERIVSEAEAIAAQAAAAAPQPVARSRGS